MSEQFLHGIEVIESDASPRFIASVNSSVIGLIGTAPLADAIEFPLNKPVLISGLKQAVKLGKQGTLLPALNGIFAQIGTITVVVRVEEDEDTETIANFVGDASDYSGVSSFLSSESIVHVTPRILIAPGFSQNQAVLDQLIKVADKLRAIVIADSPSDLDVIAFRKKQSSARVYLVDPWVKVLEDPLPPSPYVAGLIARIDQKFGFWWSPSNQEIYGISGSSQPIDFNFGDHESRANFLNEHDVATIIHKNGYRLWGNRTCAIDQRWAFLSVRRTADVINDSVLRAHLWAVDRNITRTYLNDVTESVNAYLSHLVSIGAILGGKCYFDPDLNTKANLANGKVCFDFTFTPCFPAEKITFRSHLVNDYLKEIM